MRREDEIVILKTGTPTCPLCLLEDWNYSTTQILAMLNSNWYLRFLLGKGSYWEPPRQLYFEFIACQRKSFPSNAYQPRLPSAASAGESRPWVFSVQARLHTSPSSSRSGYGDCTLVKVCELAHPVREWAMVINQSEDIYSRLWIVSSTRE